MPTYSGPDRVQEDPSQRPGAVHPQPGAGVLRGQVALVLGATGSLGQAAALAFAEAGASVVLMGRRVPALEKLYDRIVASGWPQPAIYPMDVMGASFEDWQDLAGAIEREWGRLNGVLFAQAHFQGLCSLELTGPQEWLQAVHVNLNVPVLCLQACLPLMRKSAVSKVMFVLEDEERTQQAYWGGYGVAKAGERALYRMLGHELENSSVRVHALRPGSMTGRLRSKAYASEFAMGQSSPQQVALEAVCLLAGAAPAQLQDVDQPIGCGSGT